LGKAVVIGTDKRVFKVTGITEDPPDNSISLQPDIANGIVDQSKARTDNNF
jgi:hypothetical protein